jgi:hypothetical protein
MASLHSPNGNSDLLRLNVRASWELVRLATPASPDYAAPSAQTRYEVESRERGHREAKQSYVVASDPPILLEQFGFPVVDYVVIQNHQLPTPPASGVVFITWTDNVTGDVGRQPLIPHAFTIIPNPMPYDPATATGGIVLEASAGETTGLVVVTVGAEA